MEGSRGMQAHAARVAQVFGSVVRNHELRRVELEVP